MSLLRGALLCTPAAVAESEGQSLATVPDPSHEKDGLFLLVGWYKRRGATDLCRVVGDHDTWPASLADVERAIVWAQGPGLLAADDLHRMAAIGEAMVREIATPGAVDLVLKHATPAEAVGWLVDTLRDRGL